MTAIQITALAGIGLNSTGVLTLFYFGMPFRIETKGESAILMEGTDHAAIAAEARYRALGYLGLLFVLLGSALQAAAVFLA